MAQEIKLTKNSKDELDIYPFSKKMTFALLQSVSLLLVKFLLDYPLP